MQKRRQNYQRGGVLFLLVTLVALLIVYLSSPSTIALASISIFGLGISIFLITLAGHK